MPRKRKNNYWEMVWMLAKTDFKLRYHGSFLGFFWVILKPLMQFVILNFVFTNIFHGGTEYSLGLFTGIVLWGFFSEGTMVGITSLISKAHIITKISIPKWIIVASSILNTLLNFGINLCVLILFYILGGVVPSFLGIMGMLYYCILITIVIISFTFLTAPLFLKFRDLNQVWEVVLMAGFYVAPIIYPITIMPEHIRSFLYLNPMTLPIVHVRNFLLHNDFSQMMHLFLYSALVIAFFMLSYFIFTFTSKRSAENV